MRYMRTVCKILVGKPEGKRPLGRPRRRWVNNIRMGLRKIGWRDVDWMHLARKIGWRDVDWMHLAQQRDQWRVLVNTVLDLPVP
jgi:hypothetical protein